VTAVMLSGLRITDPILTTAFITRNHGYMIYDTLFGMDSEFNVRPQMVGDWSVSEDKETYTFTLRDGLEGHDGKPVTSAACIASMKRWAKKDTTGQILMTIISAMKIIDDKSFQIVLRQPSNLLLSGLAKVSSRPAFMMPKRIAETPASEPI